MQRLWNRWIAWASPQINPNEKDATFAEREATRRGHLLAALSGASLLLDALLLVVCLLPRPEPSHLSALLITMLLQGVSVLPNRRGQTRKGVLLFLGSHFTGCTLGLFLAPPHLLLFSLFIYLLFSLPVMMSGFLLGRQSPFVSAGLSLGIVSLHVALNGQRYTRMPGFEEFPILFIAAIPGGIFLHLALLSAIGERSTEQAILHAEQVGADHEKLEAHHEAITAQADELSAMNAELLAVQAQLEAQYRALEAANSQLATLATTDSMTTLANHRAFHEELTHQIARVLRSRAPLALMLLDVDYFKEYNDSFGHPAGDEVLKSVARILQTRVREGDFPARYGGEEFAVVLQDTDAETALQVALRIREEVENFTFPHRKITVSIGIAAYAPGEEADAMIQRADVALYEAKSLGRNRVIYLPATEVISNKQTGAEAGAGLRIAESEPLSPLAVQGAETESASLSVSAEAWKSTSSSAEYVVQLLGGLEGLLQEATAPILIALLDILDRRSVESWGHSVRVTRYSLRLGNEVAMLYENLRATRPLLPRMTPGDLANLAFGALLHDIGKMGIPDTVLRKQGKLTEDEWRQIRRHPLAGAELIAEDPLLSRALPIIRSHHERWDGTGYPQGLRGEAIPLVARIFAVCDAFDSLTVARAYRTQVDFAEAREVIAREAGAQFDPDVVQAFLSITEADWQNLASPWQTLPPGFERFDSLKRAA